jgi:hypothetical protein
MLLRYISLLFEVVQDYHLLFSATSIKLRISKLIVFFLDQCDTFSKKPTDLQERAKRRPDPGTLHFRHFFTSNPKEHKALPVRHMEF